MPCSAQLSSVKSQQPLPFSGPSGSLVGLSPSCAHVSPTGFSAPVNTAHGGSCDRTASASSHGGQLTDSANECQCECPSTRPHSLTRAQMYSDPHSVLLYSHHILNTHVHTRLHTCYTVHTAFIHVHTCLYCSSEECCWHIPGNMAHSISWSGITCGLWDVPGVPVRWGRGLPTAEPCSQPATAMARHDCYYSPEVDKSNASQNQDQVYQGGRVHRVPGGWGCRQVCGAGLGWAGSRLGGAVGSWISGPVCHSITPRASTVSAWLLPFTDHPLDSPHACRRRSGGDQVWSGGGVSQGCQERGVPRWELLGLRLSGGCGSPRSEGGRCSEPGPSPGSPCIH